MTARSRPPYVTLLLIAANIVAAFIVLVRPDFADQYGFRSADPSCLTALTSLFVHANALHLMGNMVFLAAVGVAVEIATGSARFSLVYFLSGLAGVGLYWMATRRVEDAPALVGASGAIAGCAGYYSLRYTKLRVPLAPSRSASVAVVTVVWLVLQLAGAVVNVGEPIKASGFLAHLGGAVVGVLLGLLMKAPDLGRQRIGHEVLDALNDRGPEAQIAHIKAHLSSHPDDWEMQLKLAQEYEELGDKVEETSVLASLVFRVSGDTQVKAVERLAHLKQLGSISSVRRRQLADTLPVEVAILVLDSVIQGPKSDLQRPEAILDLAARLKDEFPERATELLKSLSEEYPLHSATEVARKRGWLA